MLLYRCLDCVTILVFGLCYCIGFRSLLLYWCLDCVIILVFGLPQYTTLLYRVLIDKGETDANAIGLIQLLAVRKCTESEVDQK